MIERQIFLANKRRIEPLNVVYASKLPINLEIMDYTIPSAATAKAYAKSVNDERVFVCNCSKTGNTITFTPTVGFFLPGYNELQIEVINGGNLIITFLIDVYCDTELAVGSTPATPEEVLPYVVRAETAATGAEASATKADNLVKSLPSSFTNVLADVNALKTRATTVEGRATDLERRATALESRATTLENKTTTLETRLKSGLIADAELHLGFYLDADGDLCQKED